MSVVSQNVRDYTPIRENQMDKKMEAEMETGCMEIIW